MMNNIIYTVEQNIARIGMNRPDKRNSMSTDLVNELVAALKAADVDNDVKVVVLYGEGKAFSAGGDIDTFLHFNAVNEFVAYMENTATIVETLKNMNKLVVAAVHGFAAGAGFSLALAADFIVAHDDAKFICSFTNVGLIPDLGLIRSLSNRVPSAIAKEWMVSGKQVLVAEAEARGLINRITSGDVVEAAAQFASSIANTPPLANKFVKYLVDHSAELTNKTAMMQENIIQALLLQSKDNKEGLLAFAEKRKPQFTGK